jgi:hypothetical protein
MNTPFLILGYERSGTTLLRRLVSMHPALSYEIVHENTKGLMSCRSRKEALAKLTYPSTQNKKETGATMSIRAGQKVAYTKFKTVESVMKKFESFFPDFSIIHIERDPISVISSQVRTFSHKVNKCVSRYFSSVPKTKRYLEGNKTILFVKYGEMVGAPVAFAHRLYLWMGQDVDEAHINKVLTTRQPWSLNGKIMCGLRYFDSVSKKESPIVLDSDIVNIIQSKM